MTAKIQNFINSLTLGLKENKFVKLSLGAYKGNEEELKSIFVVKVLIKREEKLSFTFKYATKHTVKNFSVDEGVALINAKINPDNFQYAHLYTIEFDCTLQFLKNDSWNLKKIKPSIQVLPSMEHDRKKNRQLNPIGKKYLQELRITDQNGIVYKAAQDKYRQINHFIEILSSRLKKLPKRDFINIVDMGSGKGYLTFALYDYLNNTLKLPAIIKGVESRKELVSLCNSIAKKASFNNLKFVHETIENYNQSNINVLIALHACDTATDDAIFKGIQNKEDLIVVAPCCHKQIRREMESNPTLNELEFITKHGIFLERQAEMVTDGLRALLLEYFGYSTKAMDFISDAHTPKNVLLIAKKHTKKIKKEEILSKIKNIKSYFGISQHHLEKRLDV